MTLDPAANPLTAAHYDQVMQGLYQLTQAKQLIGAAQAAGMDVRAHVQTAEHLERQLEGIRTHFFPAGRPKP